MNWPKVVIIACGVLALWSVAQVVYLIVCSKMAEPTHDAEFIGQYAEGVMTVGLIVFSVFAVIFGLGAYAFRRTKEVSLKTLSAFPGFPAAVFLGLVLGLVWNPAYQVFADFSDEIVVKREIHLIPPGMIQQEILFDEIKLITGEPVYYESETSECYRYTLVAITYDERQIELGRGPERSTASAALLAWPEALVVARKIADKSDARFEMR